MLLVEMLVTAGVRPSIILMAKRKIESGAYNNPAVINTLVDRLWEILNRRQNREGKQGAKQGQEWS